MGPFWRLIHSLCIPSPISASNGRRVLFALLAVVPLLCPAASRADTYYVTFYNVTFTATCIGGGTCTELINGSGFYDPVANTATGSLQLTGTLNASLIYGTPPQCTAPGCLAAPVLYDPNALPGYNPIEFFAGLPILGVPTPLPLAGGVNGSLLFVPGMCGGDQPACNTTGAFPGNGATDYLLTSGTYTSVDISTPEPGSLILLATGVGMLGLLSLRRYRPVWTEVVPAKNTLKRLLPLLPLLALCCTSARADIISYTDSGTFSTSTVSSAFSGPGDTWALSFEADRNPVALAFGMGGVSFEFSDFSYFLNGTPVPITPTFIRFFSANNGGGFLICFNGTTVSSCTDGLGTASFGWPQMYTDPPSAPTLLTGAFTTDFAAVVNSTVYAQADTTVQATAVPEPSTLLLVLPPALLMFSTRRLYLCTWRP